MLRDSALELKLEVMNSLYDTAAERIGAGAESLVRTRVDRRLAVGVSEFSKSEFRLELRVQRRKGPAYERAKTIKDDKAKGEAHIDVIPRIEIPPISTLRDSKSSVRLGSQKRPLSIGLSVGHAAGGAGTLGCFVETPDGDGLLSNQHVISPNDEVAADPATGDRIYQPGKPDLRGLAARDAIARVANYGIVERNDRNTVDWGVAKLLPHIQHEGNRIPKGLRCPFEGKLLNRAAGYEILGPAKRLCKIGRTTGFTRGTASAIALDNVPVWTSAGNVIFDDLIEVRWESKKRPFSLPGDSGSVVFTDDELAAVGLHFAGYAPSQVSYACNLMAVLKDCQGTLLD